jgi:DNA helicase HerA-like ATPase
MQVYRLDGNTLDVIACPPDDVRKGDYLLLEEAARRRGLIVQVVNIGYANVPGILEDLLRESSSTLRQGEDMDLLGVQSFLDMIRDAKVFRCKIRRALVDGRLSHDVSWTPSRSSSRLTKLHDDELIRAVERGGGRYIDLGVLGSGEPVRLRVATIDGRLNIITGKKGTGKSHLSKLLLTGLTGHGGICLVFDVNGEYVDLDQRTGGGAPSRKTQIRVLKPGRNFKITLAYTGLNVLLRIASTVLDLPANSAWEFRRLWKRLADEGGLTMKNLGAAIRRVSNLYVRDALLRRHENLVASGLFTDDTNAATTLEDWLHALRHGGALVVNLRDLSASMRRIVVEFTLSKLTRLLARRVLHAVFLFAEEAHLYLRGTYWDDIVTRMRHLGVFSTFITNQPDSISEGIYRQADNVFLFNFTNENDLAMVSKATMVDVETVTTLAKELPPRYCLALGKAVNDLPLIVAVHPLTVKAHGETRLFFREPLTVPQ